MPGAGGSIAVFLALGPFEPMQGGRLGAIAACGVVLLEQGERGRQPEVLVVGGIAEGAGGVQVPERRVLLVAAGRTLQLAGDQAGDGGRIGRELLRSPAGKRFGGEGSAAGAVEQAERFEQQQVGKGKGAHRLVSLLASRQRSRPAIT
jgi:hypothetical protein